MSGELSRAAGELLASFDSLDFDAVLEKTADQAQIVDDLSRRRVRGKSEIGAHMRHVGDSVSSLRTDLRNVSETVWGEAGVLTCELEQTYTQGGREQRSAGTPATLVFHREGDDWKLALFHVVTPAEQT